MSHGCKLPRRAPSLVLLLAALLWLAAGCEDRRPPPPPADPVPPPVHVTPSGPLGELISPPEVLLFGGSNSPLSLMTRLQRLTKALGSPVTRPELAPLTLQQELRLQSAEGIDLSRPMRFALFDPKLSPEPIALVFGTKSRAQLVASLPADRQANDAGNEYSYPAAAPAADAGAAPRRIYLSFIDDFAVVTRQPTAFPTHKTFLAGLIGAKVPGELALVASATNVLSIYQRDLDTTVEAAKERLRQAASGPGRSALQLIKVIDFVAALAGDLDRLHLTLELLEDGGKLTVDLQPRPQSKLAGRFGQLGRSKLALLGRLPADTPFFATMSVDPDGDNELARYLAQFMLHLGIGSADVPEKYNEALGRFFVATTGELTFAAHALPEGGEQLALSGIFGLRDAAQARAALRAMHEKKSVLEGYEKLGLKVSFKPSAYQVGEVEVDLMTVELVKPKDGEAVDMKQKLGSGAAILEAFMSTHFALHGDLGIIAHGKEGKATIEAFLGGKLAGGLDQAPGMQRAGKHVAPNAFFMIYGSPVDVIKRIKLDGQTPLLPQAAHLPSLSRTGVVLSAGAAEGRVRLVLDVPAEQVVSVAQLVMAGRRSGLGLKAK